jgi:hypothetical protein
MRSLLSKYRGPRADFDLDIDLGLATWNPPADPVFGPPIFPGLQRALNVVEQYEGFEIDLDDPDADPILPENVIYPQRRNMTMDENLANIFERRRRSNS